MKGFSEKILHSMKEYFSNLTKKEKIRFTLLAFSVVILSIIAAYLLGRVNYVVLYSGLDAATAGEARAAVEQLGYTVKTQGSDTLMVAEGTQDEIKQKLAADGFGAVRFDYDLLNSASGFGMTDQVTKTHLNLLVQEHLQTVIRSYVMVEDCLVMIAVPEASSFVRPRGEEQASVSVKLTLKDGMELTNTEARSIARGIMTSLSGLSMENISITDQYARYYQIADVDEGGSDDVEGRMRLEEQLANRYENSILTLLSQMLGLDNFRVSVNVRMTMDDESISSVAFTPPVEGATEGIAVSLSKLYESARTNGDAIGIPGTDENGMNTVIYPELVLDDDEVYHKYAEEINYEINETRTVIEREKGRVTALTCAVSMNSNVLSDDYVPLVQELISTTLGVDTENVSVQNAPFQPVEAAEVPEQGMTPEHTRKIIETAINGVVVLLLALAMLGLIRTIYKGGKDQVILANGTGVRVNYIANEQISHDESPVPEMGMKLKSDGLEQLEGFIERDAEAVAMMLRNWLADE